MAKISDDTVREMREVYRGWKSVNSREKGYGTLALIFGCSRWTARDIVTYRTRFGKDL